MDGYPIPGAIAEPCEAANVYSGLVHPFSTAHPPGHSTAYPPGCSVQYRGYKPSYVSRNGHPTGAARADAQSICTVDYSWGASATNVCPIDDSATRLQTRVSNEPLCDAARYSLRLAGTVGDRASSPAFPKGCSYYDDGNTRGVWFNAHSTGGESHALRPLVKTSADSHICYTTATEGQGWLPSAQDATCAAAGVASAITAVGNTVTCTADSTATTWAGMGVTWDYTNAAQQLSYIQCAATTNAAIGSAEPAAVLGMIPPGRLATKAHTYPLCAASDYSLGMDGANDCSAGAVAMLSRAACFAAAVATGVQTFAETLPSGTSLNGCYMSTTTNTVYFNANAGTGTSAAGYKTVCTNAYALGVDGVNACGCGDPPMTPT